MPLLSRVKNASVANTPAAIAGVHPRRRALNAHRPAMLSNPADEISPSPYPIR